MADAPEPIPPILATIGNTSDNLGEEAVLFDADTQARLVKAARETAKELKATVRQTRDRAGRIRQAKFIAAVLALRLQGFKKPAEIAQIIGCSVQQVTGALQRVRTDATIDQQLDRLDQIAVPLAIDNVIEGIINGDKHYTTRLMEGRGLYRVHKSVEAQVKQTVLRMEIKMTVPPHLEGKPLPMAKQGAIVGASMLTAHLGAPAGEKSAEKAEVLGAPLP